MQQKTTVTKTEGTALKPVVYLYGTEDYLIEEAVAGIKSLALKGGFESMNCQVFEGRSSLASDVVAASMTMPAFSDKRVVWVKGAEAIKASGVAEYCAYIKDPSPTTCLVFTANTDKLDKSSDLVKCLDESGYLRAMKRLTERELLNWIKNEARRQGKGIKDTAAQKLLTIAGGRLRDVKGELDKILIFAGENPVISDEDVEGAGLDCREETIFSLSDAIGARDMKKALRIYAKLSGEEPVKVVGAIARQIRTLLMIKALLRKGVGSDRFPGLLRIPPFHVGSYVKRSGCFTERELRGAVNRLYSVDKDLKTGRMPQKVVLSKLIIDLCGQR